jgi:predicted DNA-binding protein
MVPFGLRLKPETYVQLVKFSKRQKRSRNKIAREAIELWIERANGKVSNEEPRSAA